MLHIILTALHVVFVGCAFWRRTCLLFSVSGDIHLGGGATDQSEYFLRDSRAMSCPRRVFFHSVGNNFRDRQIVGQETGSDGQFGTPLKLYTFQQSEIDAYCCMRMLRVKSTF